MAGESFNRSQYISFRSDVDGMRAVAVLSVVLFHIGIPYIPGGFAGVDVFFVISGFLITQDIVRRIEEGSFSLIEFYFRRIRRIFPALVFVLILSSVAAFLILLPSELESYAKSLASAIVSLSNFVFYRRNGYFAASSEETPLLHTWSLAVEEQFYVIWPLLLLVAARFFGRCGVSFSILSVFAISLFISQSRLESDPSFSYYLLPSRAWELALGGALGLLGTGNLKLGSIVSGLLTAGGLLSLAFSILFYSSFTPFPGLSALVPTLGTALVIFAGQFPNPVSAVLSSSPFTYFGRLSYPLYLVHWPIIVFCNLAAPRKLTFYDYSAQVIGMIALSILIVKVIEPPFRRLPATKTKWRFWIPVASAPVLASAVFLICIMATDGLPKRHVMPLWVASAMEESSQFQSNECLVRNAELPAEGECNFGNLESDRVFVLWGDSHAAQLLPVFRAYVEEQEVRGVAFTKAGCAPIPAVKMLPTSEMRSTCEAFNAGVLERLRDTPNLEGVLFAGRWAPYLSGYGLISETGGLVDLATSHETLAARISENSDFVVDLGASPVIATVAPIGAGDVFSCAARAAYLGQSIAACDDEVFETDAPNDSVLEVMLPSDQILPRLNLIKAICADGAKCDMFEEGEYRLLDDEHLSAEGALLLLPALRAAFGVSTH